MEIENKGISTNFGRNWKLYHNRFLRDSNIEMARKSMVDFYGHNLVAGKRFLDIGGGSGVHSLAAFDLGAAEIMTFDVDRHSVECCEELWRQKGKPENWKISVGSILDKDFTKQLGKFDFVYAWGVLHHTGDLWRALENSAALVADDGYFHLAIYNQTGIFGICPDGRLAPSSFWPPIKKFYSGRSGWWQNFFDYIVMACLIFGYLLTFNNPWRRIADHEKQRGASWRIDIKDWLAGYPYECARPEDLWLALKTKGFSLVTFKTYDGLGNNELLLQKNGGEDAKSAKSTDSE